MKSPWILEESLPRDHSYTSATIPNVIDEDTIIKEMDYPFLLPTLLASEA